MGDKKFSVQNAPHRPPLASNGAASGRRKLAYLAIVLGLFAGISLNIPQPDVVYGAKPTRASKFEICHRTNAIKNPYRRINIAWGATGAHDDHAGIVFSTAHPAGVHGTTVSRKLAADAGYSAGSGTPPTGGNARWGDIFRAYKGPGAGNTREINWDAAGQAIFNGSTFTYLGVTKQACRTMSASEFLRSEVDAGVPLREAMQDLDAQSSFEDEALKSSLGGSFTTWYDNPANSGKSLDEIESSFNSASPAVATTGASSVTTSGATIAGSVEPRGVTVKVFYQIRASNDSFVDNDINDPATQAITVSPATGVSGETITGSSSTHTLSRAVTGLAEGTTYYYRFVAIATTGSGDTETETVINGSTRSFTTLVTGATDQTITFNSLSSKTYGDAAFNLSATASSGLTVSFASLTADVCTVSGIELTIVNVGTCTVVASQGGSTSAPKFNPAPQVERSFEVVRKTVTVSSGVTATNRTYDSTRTATVSCSSVVLTGVVSDDVADVSISCSSASGLFDDANVGSTKTVTVSGLQLGGARSNRYILTQPTLTGREITARSITITASDQAKSSGSGTTPSCTVTVTSGALQGSDAITGATCTYTSTGSSTAPDDARTDTITPSAAVFGTGSASNYSIIYATGTITVSSGALPQTISFGSLADKTYGASTFTISATSQTTGAAATGLTVSFTATTGTCSVGASSISANVSSATVTLSGAGTCTIQSTQAGGSNGGNTYASATAVNQSFTINPKSITVTADNKSKTVGAADPTFTVTVTGGLVGSDEINGATFTFSGGGYGPSTTPPSAANTYTNTPSLATFSAGSSANYTINYVAGTYTISSVATTTTTTTIAAATTTTTTIAAATTTTTTRAPRRITICHATGSASNPYVQITVDAEGLNGHGDHPDDIIPAPAGGCSARAVARATTTTTRVPRRVTICHATGSETNPYVEITVDVEGLNGHGDHEGDIIPAPVGGCSTQAINSERATTTTAPRRVTICHATGSETNPYVEITVDANGLNGHGAHEGDIIPAPAGGCSQRAVRQALAVTTSTAPRRITICHRTSSETNPYVEITVDANSLSGHGDHTGDIIPAPAGGCNLDNVVRVIATTTTLPAGSLGRTQQQVNDTRNGGQNQNVVNNLQVGGSRNPNNGGGGRGGGGGGGGTITLQPRPNTPSPQLLNVRTRDPRVRIRVRSSGSNYNQPSTWVNEGFGSYCWKIEPFADSDYTYTLPNPSSPPDPEYAGLPYSAVIVKAGSVVESDPAYQANSVFMNPAAGSVVFADVNKNGISDPGGQGGGLLGDKSISHIVLCVGESEFPDIAVTTTTTPGATTTTTTPGGTTTTTVPGGSTTTTTTVPGGSTTTTTTVPGGSTTTTTPDGSTTTTTPGGTTTTTTPGATTTTTPGATTTTTPGATTTTTTIPPGGSSPTTTSPGATPTTLPEGSPPAAPPPLEVEISAPPGVPLPPVIELELFLTTGTANERVVLTVFTENFDVPEPYSTPPLLVLPETGVERWTDRQMYGFGFIAFGLGLMMFGATRRLRRR